MAQPAIPGLDAPQGRAACSVSPVRAKGWWEWRDGPRFVLARHWPPRFDVAAQAAFPAVRRRRLAHHVRQDMWRAFRHLRGFSPVVQVDAGELGVTLRAGGRVAGSVPPQVNGDLHDLLHDPVRRARWITHAAKGAA